MKKIKYFSFLILSFFLFVGFSNAASITVSSSAKSVVVGNTFTVKVGVNGSDAFGWEYCLNYDTSVLSLVSATSDTGSKCVKTGSDMTGGRNVTFTFKAIKSGSSTVSLTGVNVYNESLATISVTKGSATITAKTQAEIEASYSDNAYLSSLTIDGYTLNPVFNKDTLEYNLEVENEVEKINIVAKKADSKASLSGSGEKALVEGANKFTIVVTAQKGNTKKYVINVTRKELNPINVTLDNNEYAVVRKAESLEAPNLYTATTVMIGTESVPAFSNEVTGLVLVGLKNEEGNIELYIYDQQKDEYSVYKQLDGSSLVIIPIETEDKMDGYSSKEMKISENDVTVYYKDSDNIVLVYGMNAATGEKSWYQYDKTDGTFQKYYEVLEAQEEIKVEDKDILLILLIMAVALGISILVIIILIVIYSRAKKKNGKLISILEEKQYKEDINSLRKNEDIAEDVVEEDFPNPESETKVEDEAESLKNEESLVTDETIENNIIDNDTIELEFDKSDISLAEQAILNNIAKANDKNFEESQEIRTVKEVVTEPLEDEIEIKEISPSLTKKELKKLEKVKRKEEKIASRKAKKEFLDDIDFEDDSAFDKYVREETEVIPVIEDLEDKTIETDNKKSKKKKKS